MLIKTTTDLGFFFFDAVTHAVVASVAIFLIISEVGIFGGYFARNWPLLSLEHGFVGLASAMIILGMHVLACFNKSSNSKEHLGMAFWRVVIMAGILSLILGILNLIASKSIHESPTEHITDYRQNYVFRDTAQGITARQVRARGAEAADVTYMQRSNTSASLAKSTSSRRTASDSSLKQFRANSKEEYTLPSYHSPLPEPQQHAQTPVSPSLYSRATWCSKKKFFSRKKESMGPPLPVSISAPYDFEAQYPSTIGRPDSTLHPSRDIESETHRWKAGR
ncbi:unnamed protein product [Aureobasidium vineae]|uniref:DUF7598 domain-containing protein n=1 Tax=Aureobasidium vineae TaxID=2773715 RepID=A0A9N8K163_9PEZI|nr:unnamed protein product [Aureobasidium vineae]